MAPTLVPAGLAAYVTRIKVPQFRAASRAPGSLLGRSEQPAARPDRLPPPIPAALVLGIFNRADTRPHTRTPKDRGCRAIATARGPMKHLVASAAWLGLICATEAKAEAAPGSPARVVEEVVVTARQPQTQTLLDRKVYAVTSDLQATAGIGGGRAEQCALVSRSTRTATSACAATATSPSWWTASRRRSSPARPRPQPAAVLGQRHRADRGADHAARAVQGRGLRRGDQHHHQEDPQGRASPAAASSASATSAAMSRALTGAYNAGPLKLSGGLGLRQDARERADHDQPRRP